VTMLEFRADGVLAQHWHHNPDGSFWSTTYHYDDAGRLITTRTENAGGFADLRVWQYDNAGRLVRILFRSGDGDDRTAESYEYDASGCKKKTLCVDITAQLPDTRYGWGVEGTDSIYSAPGATKLTTLYNERDQPTSLLFHDGAGRQLSGVEFRYDEAGRLIEEAQTNSEEVLPSEMLASLSPAQLQTARAFFGVGRESIRCTHSYDGQGHRVKTRLNMGPLAVDSKTVTYNEHGDPILEVDDHEGREFAIDDEGQATDSPTRESVSRSETRFRYDYDSQGNWVSKTIEGRSRTEDEFTLSAVERRTITYFV